LALLHALADLHSDKSVIGAVAGADKRRAVKAGAE
jgi:hypothetical protein